MDNKYASACTISSDDLILHSSFPNVLTTDNAWNNVWTATTGKINLDEEELFEKFAKRFAKAPIIQHKCHNCGANVKMDEKKNIFICPYCNSTYAVGIYRINDKGD